MKGTPARNRTLAAVMAGVLTLAGAQAPAAAAEDELAQLKAEVAALLGRIEQLEARQRAAAQGAAAAQPAPAAAPPAASSNLPSWVSSFTFKGDFRYRHEAIDQQLAARRERDRIRMRAGFVARVNERMRVELGLATSEGSDPRSSNQTLTGLNSRKDVYLDLAYVEWQALPALKVTAGKMKFPWQRPGQSVLFDSDVNPEGLAVAWSQGDFFGGGWYHFLQERSSDKESTMVGAQFGWKPSLGPGQLTLAASYFDLQGVRWRAPFHSGSAWGNSTTDTGCLAGAAICLANDYNLLETYAEYGLNVAGRPLALYVDHFTNQASGVVHDEAWSAGLLYGRASEPRSWELGYFYQSADKDSVFAHYTDSDFGAGNTDYRAHALRAGYAFARNWTLNLLLQLAETNFNEPVVISGVGPMRARDYDRLQVDMNFKF